MRTLDPQLLEQTSTGYDLGAIQQCWPATRGIENSNFFLACVHDGIEREYVLTIIEQPPSSGASLVPLLDACAAAGLPVPAPVRNREGTSHMTLDGKPAMLCPRLPGRHVLNPTRAQVASIGRFLGRLHRVTQALDLALPPYPRDLDWLKDRLALCQPYLSYLSQDLMHDVLCEVESLLGRHDVERLPAGVIHGDLFRDNALFNALGLTGVLDFHHASRGFLIYDLAVAANDWCTQSDGSMDIDRLNALLRGYHGIRALAPAERCYFPLFARYAALAFWQSRLVVALDQRRGLAARANDPSVFERIVARHQDAVPSP